ncbi:cysteine-rich venom protein TEL1-like [Mercenaria mercenaria]|uniref:cysteine-rich venom protein TEL1-like n=1 Tax=Mercenaria mercenaria TaxID=6596 RepID=UPI00234F844B|nr:cysteine-rich venom protein TEL1-like [Mercenaria mercenaria]
MICSITRTQAIEMLSGIGICMLLILGTVAGADQDECAEKYKLVENHSACKPASPDATNLGVSEADKKLIVEMHNKARKEVQPKAADMAKMSWDDSIANIAQRWVQTCVWGHDGNSARKDIGRYAAGQNMASNQANWESAVQGWIDEKQDWTFANITHDGSMTNVMHYTQVIWANSFKIGCGYAKCSGTNRYVCNYGPPGNYKDKTPYTKGTESCSACSSRCNDTLCDCGGIDCYNTATIKWDTCSCTCGAYSNAIQPNCALDCTGDKSWLCKDEKQREFACKYFPELCPNVCKWCPAAG